MVTSSKYAYPLVLTEMLMGSVPDELLVHVPYRNCQLPEVVVWTNVPPALKLRAYPASRLYQTPTLYEVDGLSPVTV